jgi:hypothetical protein
MTKKTGSTIVALILAALLVAGGLRAHGQESLLRITSPVTGDVVMEGQPLRISVSADASVRVFGILSGHPMPDARPVGSNQYEMVIPKTVPPGRYNLTAVGVTSTDVESAPVTIQVEREDPAIEVEVQPSLLSFAELGDKFRLRVYARFADGSSLDVTHSLRISFTPRDPQVVSVDDWGMAMAVGPGQSFITVKYGATTNPESEAVYAALLINCPRPKPEGPAPEVDSVTPETGVSGVTPMTIRGRHFGDRQGQGYVCIGTRNGIVKSWNDNEIVATVPEQTHQGTIYVEQGELASNVINFVPIGLFIDAATGNLVPGEQVHLLGSGFGSEQGSGYVTVGNVKANVVTWASTEIVLTVPESVTPGKVFKIAVHQNGRSGDFPMFHYASER